MGTRAVDRIDKDYPRLVALSHPQLRPEVDVKSKRQYSQWYIDAIDLEANRFDTFRPPRRWRIGCGGGVLSD